MPASPNDLNFVLSGGEGNKKPDKSIGGYPSATSVDNKINNLFADATDEDVSSQTPDFRCIYLFNDNSSDESFFEMEVYVKTKNGQGADIQVGISFVNEQQIITFEPAPSSGTFTLTLDDMETDPITWDANPLVLAASIQSALVLLSNLAQVTVSAASSTQFIISFADDSGNRAWPKFIVTNSTLTPTSYPITFRSVEGGPINSIAPLLNTGFDEPPNMDFILAEKPGILVGTLRAGEGLPVWFKRTPNSDSSVVISQDGFDLYVNVKSQPS